MSVIALQRAALWLLGTTSVLRQPLKPARM
jgi:hypothetical protein